MTVTCPHCGFSAQMPPERIPARAAEATCPRCKARFVLQRPVAPPVTAATALPADTAAAAPPVDYAGFWVRVTAACIDGIAMTFLAGFFAVALFVASALLLAGQGPGAALAGAVGAILLLPLFFLALAMNYLVVFTGNCGQTPGKMLMRIRVVRTDGGDITYRRAALRELLGKGLCCLTLGAGFLMAAFDERKQGLHDKLAGTCVIHL